MSKYSFLALALLILTSCAHKEATQLSETMLPDGRTWQVKSKVDCIDNQSANKCKDRLQEIVTKYGSELCGKTPERVFACAVRGEYDYTIVGSCYLTCPK